MTAPPPAVVCATATSPAIMRSRRMARGLSAHRKDAMTNRLALRDHARHGARLAAMLLLLAGGPALLAATAAEENTVRLTVDYGDGVAKTVNDLAWSKGNTVLDAMKAATSRASFQFW